MRYFKRIGVHIKDVFKLYDTQTNPHKAERDHNDDKTLLQNTFTIKHNCIFKTRTQDYWLS